MSELGIEDLRLIERTCTQFESHWTVDDSRQRQADRSKGPFDQWLRDTSGIVRSTLFEELSKIDDELRAESSLADAAKSLSKRYDITRELGSGGIGVVYQAYDRQRERNVAIKVLRERFRNDPEASRRFVLEARLTGQLQHPGVPPVYEAGLLANDLPYFSMKIVEGETLAQTMQTSPGTRNRESLLAIFEKVAETLAFAHDQGVLHRDLKPQNVMVGRFGEVQLMDWGLAKRIEVGGSDWETSQGVENGTPLNLTSRSQETVSDLTGVDDFIGSPRHIAPEQALRKSPPADTRIDVFGLGTILFQILTDQTLYPHDSAAEAVKRIREGDLSDAYEQLTHVERNTQAAECATDEIVDLCRRCLSVRPDDRPANGEAVAAEVKQYRVGLQSRLAELAIERSNEAVRSREQTLRTRWIVGTAAIAITLISIAALAAVDQWQKSQASADAERVARLTAERQTRSTQQINAYLTQVFSATRPEAMGHEVTYREVLDKAVADLDGRFADQPDVEGVIRETLGETYHWLDGVEVAEAQLRLAMAAYERVVPPDPTKILRAKSRLADVLWLHDRDEDPEDAIAIYRGVYQESLALWGPSDRRTVDAQIGLGRVLQVGDHFSEGESISLNAIQIIRDTPALADYDTTPARLNIARSRKHDDRYKIAEQMYQAILNDPNTRIIHRLPALTQLGEMYQYDERLDEAADVLAESLELHERELGKLHRLTLSTLRKYLRVLIDAKRWEDTLPIVDESIDRHTKWDGIARSSVLEARLMKAKTLVGLDRRDEAKSLLKETIAVFAEHRGPDHRSTLRAKKQLDRITE